MNFYKLCNFTLESNVSIPELPHASGNEPECSFQLLPARDLEPLSCKWFNHWRFPNGEPWLWFTKQAPGYLLRFADLADFFVSAEGKEIHCYPTPGAPLETIRHLFLDQVMPLVLSMWGRLVLHASTVVTRQGAIAFLGITGQGKSTLAGSFVKQGFPLLTDDCLLLEEEDGQPRGFPSYPGLRLQSEVISALFGYEGLLFRVAHYTEKKRLGLDNNRLRFCADPIPLKRLYILAPPVETEGTGAIRIVPLSPRDALMELVKHAYRLDITDRKRLRGEFEYLGRMASWLLVCRLTFPRRFSLLPAVQEAILEDLSK